MVERETEIERPMKATLLVLLSALVLVLSFTTSESFAAVDSDVVETATVELNKGDCASDTKTYAACLQCCLEQYTANLAACTDACEYCSVWILFCVSWSVKDSCVKPCQKEAKEVQDACKSGCLAAATEG